MKNSIGLLAALAAIVVVAGCGLVGTEPNEPSQKSGKVTVGDTSVPTQSVTCTQVEQLMTIRAVASPGNARAELTLGGQKPVVQTVNLENINGLNAVVGGAQGKAEASADGTSSYKITGTAVVSDAAHPGQTRNLPFTFDAPC